jgi:hypothetical protein
MFVFVRISDLRPPPDLRLGVIPTLTLATTSKVKQENFKAA